MNPEHVARAYDFLWNGYKAGIFLGCCGAPAYWAGRDDLLNDNLTVIRDGWESLGKPKFVTACASCARMFAELLPEVETVSLYELLAGAETLAPQAVFANAAIFDPCSAREDELMRDAVRAIASRAGIYWEELPEKGRCCGNGGHMRLANPALYEEMTRNRAELSDKPYIVYCANCRDVFSSRGKACAHILDAAFGLESLPIPCISEKRKNSVEVKSQIMERIEGKTLAPQSNPWDSIELVIEPELANRIDRKLISTDDIREAIFQSEHGGARFFDSGNGEYQCSLVKPVLTYWVRYKPLGRNAYEVLGAFYHRMRFDKEG
jgi:hypothetical protein